MNAIVSGAMGGVSLGIGLAFINSITAIIFSNEGAILWALSKGNAAMPQNGGA
jgi:hypothetical protein